MINSIDNQVLFAKINIPGFPAIYKSFSSIDYVFYNVSKDKSMNDFVLQGRLKELVIEWTSIAKNRHKLQVFMNSRLAKPFQLIEEYIGANKLGERLEIYNAEIPTKTEICNGVGVLTCGVDIQQNRIEAYVWGYGKSDECYLIDFRLFEGDTNKNIVSSKRSYCCIIQQS